MKTSDRVKILRKELKLSQEAFGAKIGITNASVSRIESGVHNLSDQTAKLICATFNVDYFWLTEGADVDMFTAFPESIIDEVAEQFDLNKDDRALIETYLEASHEERKAVQNFFQTFAKKIQKDEE
ncbi:helix-turn-helix domain-containing protein [[Clostridium] innocuum]|nr:helix-turn-helix domain-containing protein [[Clostridium] innocuum]